MKAKHVQRILVVASLFASFIVYLCVSLADIVPIFIAMSLCVAAVSYEKTLRRVLFASVKLTVQKAE